MENNIEIIIEPHNDDYDPSDNRWLAQVNDLVSDCEREVGEVRKNVTPVEGQKGGNSDIGVSRCSYRSSGYL